MHQIQSYHILEVNYEMFDIEERNAYNSRQVTSGMIKCARGFNTHGLRVAMINEITLGNECTRRRSEETWEHVIKYNNTKELRKHFAKDLLCKLEKYWP